MASLIDELIGVLNDEKAVYDDVYALANEKTSIIASRNIDALKEIMQKEQLQLEKISKLEKKRQSLIKDMAIVLNKNEKTLDLKGILEVIKGRPKDYNALAEARDGLRNILTNTQRVNDLNKTLLKDAQEMVEFDINLIKNASRLPETANYSKDGTGSDYAYLPTRGRFDTKQ